MNQYIDERSFQEVVLRADTVVCSFIEVPMAFRDLLS